MELRRTRVVWVAMFGLAAAACGDAGDSARADAGVLPVGDGDSQQGDGDSQQGDGDSQQGDGDSQQGDGDSGQGDGGQVLYGQPFSGGEFHLGPVDWEESAYHNACAPIGGYRDSIRASEGNLLAGLWNGIPNVSSFCDVCILATTGEGKSALLRVVTFGDTTANSIDVSPEAYALLNSDEYPRHVSFQFARCNDSGPISYEMQTDSSEWWTSFWVRNAREPITKVEVKSANHPEFTELMRGSDGTLNDQGGFGMGPFSIRLTSMSGAQVVHHFEWPADGLGDSLLTAPGNF
jgi:hypothetical protein